MTSLSKLQANTSTAAADAYASGQITFPAHQDMTDGTVTKHDLEKAANAMAMARVVLSSVNTFGTSPIRIAEKRMEIAEQLYAAIEGQLNKQKELEPAPNRPSTGGTKGSTPSTPSTPSRPSTGGTKGSTSTPRRSVSRPATPRPRTKS